MKQVILTTVIAASFLAGCSTVDKSVNAVDNGVKAVGGVVTSSQPAQTNTANSLYPPNAKAGECYARVLTPATYKTTNERVLAKSAGENIKVVPATYKTVTERVLVREASTKLKVIPETYKTITEKVMVSPANEVLTKVPQKYKKITEKVLVKPAYTTWKKGSNPLSGQKTKFDQTTGEIMCLVEVPAEYKTVTKQVIATPATTTTKTIPAKYKTVTRKVVATQATTKKITTPAQYKTVQVRKLVAPAKTLKTATPAQYKTVEKRAIATQPKLEWRAILCETNTTPQVISRLQRALKAKGYNPGRVDGVLGRETLRAVIKYQRKNNLPSGQFTIATLRSLGVQ